MPSILLSTNYTRSSFTLSDAVTRVRSDLALDNNDVITTGDVRRWLNEAQTILARDTRCFHITTVSGTTSGTAEYPLPSESNGRCIAIEEVLYNDDPLPYVTISDLYRHYSRWRSRSASTPWAYYQRGSSVVGLYPPPDTTDSDILTVTYTAIPPEVTEDEDMFYVLHGLEDALITYAKLQASLKDAFGEGKARLDYFKAEWEEARARANEIAAGLMENETISMGRDGLRRLEGSFGIRTDVAATQLP